MHRKRIIPCLDVRDGRVVKGVNFVGLRDAGDPVELAARYDAEGADELIFLDITASHERRDIIADLAARCAEQVFIPFTIGGGLGSEDDVRMILAAGADKVTMNTAAVEDPELVAAARSVSARSASSWPSTRKRVPGSGEEGRPPRWEVYVHGGRTPTGIDALAWAARAAELGAGEFMLTSMDRDGTLDGYDLELTRAVARAVDVPVIASGGVGTLEHLAAGLIEGEADAVLAASIFHFGTYTIAETKAYLAARGVPVRLGDRRRARPPGRRGGRGRVTARTRDLAGLDAADAAALARAAAPPRGSSASPRTRCTASAASYAGGRARPWSPPRAARPASRSRSSIRRWSCSRPAGARAPAARRGAPAAAGAVHPPAAVPAGPGVPAAGRGAAPHARRVGRQGDDGRHARRARARVAGGRAGPGRAAVPAARLQRQPERGAAPASVDEVDAGLLAACDLVLDAGPGAAARRPPIVDLSRLRRGRRLAYPAPGGHRREGRRRAAGGRRGGVTAMRTLPLLPGGRVHRPPVRR